MVELKRSEFIPIPLETLQIDTSKSFDVFFKRDEDKMVLYSAGGDQFTAEVRDNLIDNGIYVLYIKEGDVIPYNNYLAENLSQYLSRADSSTGEKSEFAYNTISNIGRGLFLKPTAESISSYKTAITKTLNFILTEEDSVANLINLTRLDFTTYNHSMNVGIFATGLTKALFIEDTTHNLEELATGFFLHDIGKSAIPLNILQKPGPLDSEEWALMKEHPTKGYEILLKFNHITPESQIIVLQHHERNNGTGYPQGLRGNNIHIYSKICSIADVFEALVAKRPYKKPKPFFEALQIMKEQMKNDFDPFFFKKFVLLFTDKRVKAMYA